jgi:hypothetical protein
VDYYNHVNPKIWQEFVVTEAAAEECPNSFFFSGSCRQLLRLSSGAVKFISQVSGTAQEKELVVFFLKT